LGTVVEVTAQGGASPESWKWQKTRLRVDESFGGVGAEQREVEVWTSLERCGFSFRLGKSYLVDAWAGEGGRLVTSTCSYTGEVRTAGAMLQVLRRRRDGAKTPALTGRIVQRERNFKGDWGTGPARALGGTVVRVRSGEDSFETVADADGVYAFYDLPRGKYDYAAELPQGMVLTGYVGTEEPPRAVGVTESGCQMAELSVTSRGSIAGRLVDEAGRPVPGVWVAVAPAEKQLSPGERLYSERSDAKGEFRLLHIPPGDYVLAVNPTDELHNGFPYRRTPYPGVVRVAAGEQVTGAEIRLKREYEPRRVRVRVTWANGERVRRFVFVEAQGMGREGVTSSASTDEKIEKGELVLAPGESYEVEAKVTCRYATARSVGPGAHLRSGKMKVSPGDGKTELELVIQATGCPVLAGKKLVDEW
jgi:hypothetical protein